MSSLKQTSSLRAVIVFFLIVLFPVSGTQAETGQPDLLFILDASGSMWGQIEGENKIVIARRVLGELIGELPEGSNVGLVAYGHRREGDCDDIETLTPLGQLDKTALTAQIEALNPKGKTPITQSVRTAFEMVGDRESPTTVLLVSDGIETCGGDPCQAVRDAKAAGINFVMHVVGFDVGTVDVAQLECAAQVGDGLYFEAENADELGAALDQVAAAPPETPPGRLSIKAIADGKLTDVAVRVTDSATGEEVAGGRTYKNAETNPRLLPLADGTYNVLVNAVGMKGDVQRTFEGIEIKDGSLVEKVVDFSTGELAIKITRNGELSDATIRVYQAGTTKEVAAGRSYRQSKSNPKVFRITVGEYDVAIKGIEISSGPTHRITGVRLEGSGRVEHSYDFTSGTLRLGAVRDGELLDATISVVRMEPRKAVGQGRTYAHEKSNPKVFELTPGKYLLTVKPVGSGAPPKKELEVTIEAGEVVEHMFDFSG